MLKAKMSSLRGGLLGCWLLGCGAAAPASPDPAAPDPQLLKDAEPEAPPSADFGPGMQAIRDGDFGAARERFAQAVADHPGNAQAHFYLGVAQQNLGDAAAARASYEKAIELQPKLPEAWVNWTATLLDAGDAEGALSVIDRGLFHNPKHAGLSYNRALALSALGQPAQAVPAYRAALEADPSNAEIKYGYAEALIAAGSKDQGLKLLVELAGGDNVEVLASAGRLLGRLEQFDACIGALNKALTKQPAAELYVARGLCEHGKKDDETAFADFQQAIHTDPQYAPAHYYSGMHLRMQGKKEEARRALRRALEIAGAEGVGQAAQRALDSL